MNVGVTGGAGFIGANLCRVLLARDAIDHVVVLDDFSTGRVSNLDGVDVELVEGSICDPAAVVQAFDEVDAIVHLAARGSVPRSLLDPVRTHEVNVTGTVNVLEAARTGGRPVVFASSSSVYGSNPVLPKHEDLAPMPLSPYAASKLAAESYVLAYQRSFDLPALAFRFFNVFGPLQPADHDYAAVIPVFTASALAGRPLPVHGDGRQSRDFTYVDTVTAVLADAVEHRVCHDGPVNLAFGERIDLLQVIALLEEMLGHRVEVEHTEPRAGDVRHSQSDSARLLGLFPDLVPVPFAEGLRATVDWFRSIS